MALSADGTTLAVGAISENSAAKGIGGNQQYDCANAQNCADNSGAVYVFEWARDNNRNWDTGKFTAYVKAPNSGVGDWFGSAVALSADGATLAVGVPFENSAAKSIGGTQQNDCTKLDGSIDANAENCATSSGAVYLY